MASNSEQEYLEHVFLHAPEAIVLFDINGHIIKINKEFTNLFGYSLNEVKGRSLRDLIEPSVSPDGAESLSKRVAAGVSVEVETTGARSDGNRIRVFARGMPIIVDDKQVASYVTYRRIPESGDAESDALMQTDFARNYSGPALQVGFDGMVVKLNPEAETVFRGNIVGESIFKFVPSLAQIGRDAGVLDKVPQFHHTVDNRTYLFFVRKGKSVKSYFLYGGDISVLVSAEKELQVAHAKNELLLAAISSILISADSDGSVIQWNDAATAALGIKKPDALGTQFDEIPILWKDPEVAEKIREFRLRDEPMSLGDIVVRLPGGEERLLDITINPLKGRDGASGGFLLFGKDITAQRAAKEELRQIRTAVDAATVAICITDRSGTPTYVNPAFAEIFHSELGGVADVESLYQDRNLGKSVLADVLSGKSWEGEVQMISGTGDIISVQQRGTAILNDKNEVLGMLFIYADITERKNLEYQLMQAQKLKAIGQLAAGIAHEINTPMQFIGDNMNFMQQAFGGIFEMLDMYKHMQAIIDSGEDAKEVMRSLDLYASKYRIEYIVEQIPKAIEQSQKGIEKVANIVKIMKEFSHPGSKEKTTVDINRALRNTIEVTRNRWKYVADVETNFDASLPEILGFPGELNQVFLNIIINAAQAIEETPEKGEKKKGLITISTSQDKEWVIASIRDSGVGIPKDAAAKIFEPFFTTKRIGMGTGQGLAISHSVVVDKHGGRITFDTKVGKGTTFHVWLPRHPQN